MCPYFEVPCPLGKCKERMMRKDIPDHLGWKCKHRESTCDFCLTKMALTDLQVSGPPFFADLFTISAAWDAPCKPSVCVSVRQKHKETVCPAFPVSCPNLCSFSSLPRSEVTQMSSRERAQPAFVSHKKQTLALC